MQRVSKIFTKFQILLIVIIFFIGIFFRFYDLGITPSGLSNDEVDTGYDAYSILITGRDQWGQMQPSPYLRGFGDYRPSLYTYLVIPSIAAFDLTSYAVRYPAAAIGSLTILLAGILSYILWKKSWISIASMFLLAVNPWHIGMSRIGIESIVGVFISLLAVILFVTGTKSSRFLYISMVFFALSIYTYAAYTLFAPLLIIACIFAYRDTVSKRKIIITLIVFVIALLPAIIFGGLKTAGTRSSQVNLTKDSGTITVINEQRGECQKVLPSIICKISINKYSVFATKFSTNYVSHFSPELLAINGTSTQYSTLPQRGLFYIFEYLIFIIGVAILIIKKNKGGVLILLWIFLSPIPDSITGGGHYSRYLLLLPSAQIAGAYGLVYLVDKIRRKKFILAFPLILIIYEVMFFGITYFSYFKVFYSRFEMSGYEATMKYIDTQKNNYDKIIISSRINDTKQYAYYLFYSKYDPYKYQRPGTQQIIKENDNWIRVRRVDNVYFLNKIPDDALLTKDTLFIASVKEVPRKAKIVKELKDLKGDVLFVAFRPSD